MTTEEIYSGLTEVFREAFEDETLTLAPGMTAVDVPGWDSFANIKLIVMTEAKFGVKFNTAEIESLRNVGHFVEVIASKLG